MKFRQITVLHNDLVKYLLNKLENAPSDKCVEQARMTKDSTWSLVI